MTNDSLTTCPKCGDFMPSAGTTLNGRAKSLQSADAVCQACESRLAKLHDLDSDRDPFRLYLVSAICHVGAAGVTAKLFGAFPFFLLLFVAIFYLGHCISLFSCYKREVLELRFTRKQTLLSLLFMTTGLCYLVNDPFNFEFNIVVAAPVVILVHTIILFVQGVSRDQLIKITSCYSGTAIWNIIAFQCLALAFQGRIGFLSETILIFVDSIVLVFCHTIVWQVWNFRKLEVTQTSVIQENKN